MFIKLINPVWAHPETAAYQGANRYQAHQESRDIGAAFGGGCMMHSWPPAFNIIVQIEFIILLAVSARYFWRKGGAVTE